MIRAFRVLARARFLRGTPFDPFGHSAERRAERRLIRDYEALIEEILGALDADRLEAALALAALPDEIRGFGPIKAAAIAQARSAQGGAARALPAGSAARDQDRGRLRPLGEREPCSRPA